MKYEIGEDGILRQVDDDTPPPSPIKPPATATTQTTTRRPTATATTQTTTRRPTTTATTQTTTRRPTTTTTTTTTTSRRPVTTTRRRVDFANIMYNASWIMIVFGVGAAAALAAQNYQLGVGFAAYFERLWYNITSAWNSLDPFYGFSVVVDELSFIPSLPSLGDTFLEIVDYLILGGGWFALLTSSIRWLFSTIIPLVRIIFGAWGMLFRLLFGFLL